VVLDCVLALLILVKIAAYLHEMAWALRGGGRKLRYAYMWRYRRGERPTRADERALGRPLTFTFSADTVFGRTLGIGMSSTGVVLLSTLSLCGLHWAPRWACALVGLLLLIMCAAALLYRTLLGPADQLNPDLGVGSFEREARGLLYSSQANIYGRYALALIGSSIVGFTVAYANVSHSAAKAFSTGPSADPIPWLYFTVTLAKTFSASGPSPTSDLAKLLVIAQIGCPPGRVSAHLQPAWL